MKTSNSESDSQKLSAAVEMARQQVATAETKWKRAKEKARVAKRRRKEVKLLVRRARKEAKHAKTDLSAARKVLAEAEARLSQSRVPAASRKSRKAPSRKARPRSATGARARGSKVPSPVAPFALEASPALPAQTDSIVAQPGAGAPEPGAIHGIPPTTSN